MASGQVDLRGPPDDVIAALVACAGLSVGAANEVALRGLGEPDAFPIADPGPDGGSEETAALLARAEAWRPWRGYAAEHLRADLDPQ